MTVSRSQPIIEYSEDLSKRMQEARYFLNFRQDGPDCDHADLIDEAIDEIESLKARVAELEGALQEIRDFPYVGRSAEQARVGIAAAALKDQPK